jgi:hypothetical protein
MLHLVGRLASADIKKAAWRCAGGFLGIRLFSVRTTFPFLRQRLRKSIKVKKEKRENVTHVVHPSTPLRTLPSPNSDFVAMPQAQGLQGRFPVIENN